MEKETICGCIHSANTVLLIIQTQFLAWFYDNDNNNDKENTLRIISLFVLLQLFNEHRRNNRRSGKHKWKNNSGKHICATRVFVKCAVAEKRLIR